VVTRGELASAELRLRLGALLRAVRAAVARRADRTAALARPEISHLAITEQHALVLLAEAERFARAGRAYGPGTALSREEIGRLGELETQAGLAGLHLPGRMLRSRGLGELDLEVLLLIAAPAVEPAFAGLYAYLNDALPCAAATPALAVDVLATGADHQRCVVEACGPLGTLRSDGWITVTPPDRASPAMLRPADGVVELLCGAEVDAGLLGRRAPPPHDGTLPAGVDPALVTSLAAALGAGRLDVIGVWGPEGGGGRAIAVALTDGRAAIHGTAEHVDVALQRASMRGAVCVLDVPRDTGGAAALAASVAAASAPVVLVGEEPLREVRLLIGRRFAEVRVPAPGFAGRRASWSAAFPELDGDGLDDLAARFRLQPEDVAAVASLDRASRGWVANGDRPRLDVLAGLVARRRSPRLASVRAPSRGMDMLVLPAAELAQVREVAAAARAWPRVAEDWRLERFGNPGVTALFAGEPGTGKTLAAEAIAAEVGLEIMVVDLSRLVSKWIGETEKHLDAVFAEAEASSCVLFFDEADSMFGQRGEVTRGADRYANLEVGYLLQRLERYEGLVVLASNLRANLDSAFTRRFHHVVHFPRPAEPERRRLWELALGPPVRLAEPLELDVLAALDLTGAGIAAIVRGAALAVHADGRDALTPGDVLTATRKQFQREARLLPRELLGPYAGLLA
jgi:hypothetical protein